MMRRRSVVTSVITLGLALSGHASAQGAPKPAPAPAKPAPAPAPAPPAAPVAPAPAPAPPAAITPAPAPTPPPAPLAPPPPADAAPPPPSPPPAAMPMEPAPPPPAMGAPLPEATSADPEPDLPPAETYSEGGDSWYDSIEFSAFADAYASVNYNFPKPQFGRNVLRAHDYSNGFALSWVGVNASYPADPVGATVSLRFGPTARQIGNGCPADDKSHCDSGEGLENVKQAFASWKPGGADSMFTLDLGKFETPYGAEVSESHLNMNYTRSMLYASQPVFHTGLRASFAVSDLFDFKVLAVNGWNNTIDNNVGKSFGAQLNFHLKNSEDADVVGISVGYLGGPEHDDTLVVHCGVGEQ
ncbi:MAG: outer membrane beta-barrel protein, partial [Myxococcales bacterium]